MKWIFALLLAINLLFFTLMRLGDSRGQESAHGHEPLRAEKVRLLPELPKAPELALSMSGAPDKPAEVPAKPSACLEWGAFSGDDLKRAELALEKLSLGDKLARYQAGKPGYWVYIGPRKSLQEAQKKADELKKLGVQESFIFREKSKWQFAISLGLFSTEAAATNFLEQLREKGVKSAVAGPRSAEGEAAVFQVRDADDSATAALTKLKQDFPGSELKAAECRKPAEEVQ
ncbi:MAG: SPOR domain-containing protein [Betaproteobacteria bacterium]